MTAGDAAAAVLRRRRELRRRAALEVSEIAEGLVVRSPDLPDVPDLNALHLDAPAPAGLSAARIGQLAERSLPGLAHHHVVLDDIAAGERLGAKLEAASWEPRRVGVMVLAAEARLAPAPEPTRPTPEAEVRRLSDEELSAAGRAAMAQEAPRRVTAEILDQLAEGLRRLRGAAGHAAGYGVQLAGEPVASATLLLDDDPDAGTVALIEEVGTLRAYREQGMARAIVSTAVAAADEAGARITAVCVDADDWPQLMYSRMGFVTVGGQLAATRPVAQQRPPGHRRDAV